MRQCTADCAQWSAQSQQRYAAFERQLIGGVGAYPERIAAMRRDLDVILSKLKCVRDDVLTGVCWRFLIIDCGRSIRGKLTRDHPDVWRAVADEQRLEQRFQQQSMLDDDDD